MVFDRHLQKEVFGRIREDYKKENIEKYGENNWNDWKEGIITGINNLVLEHKNCPDDF